MWWVTLVDATLVRYHPRDYEKALADKDRAAAEDRGGRWKASVTCATSWESPSNRTSSSARPHDGGSGWSWRPLPEPALDALAPRARQWELSRYHAYQERLAGRDIARTFARCTEFLAQAAALVGPSS